MSRTEFDIYVWGRRVPTPPPTELTDRQLDEIAAAFAESNAADLCAELANDATDAQAAAYWRSWQRQWRSFERRRTARTLDTLTTRPR